MRDNDYEACHLTVRLGAIAENFRTYQRLAGPAAVAGVIKAVLRGAGLQPTAAHHAHALHSPYWWLKCAVGPTNSEHPAVKAYLKLLTWDIVKGPAITRTAEKVLSPVLGKSLIVYAQKPAEA